MTVLKNTATSTIIFCKKNRIFLIFGVWFAYDVFQATYSHQNITWMMYPSQGLTYGGSSVHLPPHLYANFDYLVKLLCDFFTVQVSFV